MFLLHKVIMTTILKIPLKAVDKDVIRDLQEKYPDAMLHIEAEESPGSKSMDEDQFWAIIGLLDWDKESNEEILGPAVQALSRFSENDIAVFDDILAEKLYELDGQRFAEKLGSNRYTGKGHFSVDSFLYSRCCVVANGKEFYEKVLQDPGQMPKEYTFEPLLYLASRAYRQKTGKDSYDHTPDIWYETFSNPAGWPGITPLKDRILGEDEKKETSR